MEDKYPLYCRSKWKGEARFKCATTLELPNITPQSRPWEEPPEGGCRHADHTWLLRPLDNMVFSLLVGKDRTQPIL